MPHAIRLRRRYADDAAADAAIDATPPLPLLSLLRRFFAGYHADAAAFRRFFFSRPLFRLFFCHAAYASCR